MNAEWWEKMKEWRNRIDIAAASMASDPKPFSRGDDAVLAERGAPVSPPSSGNPVREGVADLPRSVSSDVPLSGTMVEAVADSFRAGAAVTPDAHDEAVDFVPPSTRTLPADKVMASFDRSVRSRPHMKLHRPAVECPTRWPSGVCPDCGTVVT